MKTSYGDALSVPLFPSLEGRIIWATSAPPQVAEEDRGEITTSYTCSFALLDTPLELFRIVWTRK